MVRLSTVCVSSDKINGLIRMDDLGDGGDVGVGGGGGKGGDGGD